MGAVIFAATIAEVPTLADADPERFVGNLINGILAVPYLAIGPYLAFRLPRNAVGWLVGVSAVVILGLGTARKYAALVGIALPQSAGVGLLLLMFAIFLFPSGRPPSRPWWLAAVALTAMVFFLGSAGFTLVLATGIVAAGSVVLRFRVAVGDERQQLKWFAYASVLTIVLLAVNTAIGCNSIVNRPGTCGYPIPADAMWGLTFLAVPVAMTIAILRYRLYDIDLIINRTLVYGLLTAMLAAIFAGGSAIVESLVEGLTGQRSDVAAFATVLLVIVAFVPLRNALRSMIDRLVPGRALLTFLFTDLVGSTDLVQQLGDARWRELLERYRLAVRRELARHGGHEVDTAGDGFFATFDSPGQAIRCADAIRHATEAIGLEARTGLHIGECEIHDGKPSGINVHTAARVMAAASADEILVSSTMRDLVAGSEHRFVDRGSHALKGLPGEWRLYAVIA